MVDVIYTPAGAALPDADRWVRITATEDGTFIVTASDGTPQKVALKYDSDAPSFLEAQRRAIQYAEQMGVAHVYAVGCGNA